jgi:hypothetical protein
MANDTLRQMAREIRLYNPEVPIGLAQRWINNRYLKIAERYMWSFKLAESQFDVPAAYSTGTVTMTEDSATVTGSGTTFTEGMVGRQFKVSNRVYTIATFTSTTSIALDQTWQDATEADLSYKILQAYITPSPTNFHSFYSVINPATAWTLRLGLPPQYLNRLDPQRGTEGTPRALFSRVYNSSDVAMFELWPHATEQATFPYLYEKRVARLTASTSPPPIIRSDVLVKGALADLARWPGLPGHPNLMADTGRLNWQAYEREFEAEVARLLIEDQNIYLNTFLKKFNSPGSSPMDADYFRTHAF